MAETRIILEEFYNFFVDKKENVFNKGEILLAEGDKIEYIDFLTEGNVYISRYSKEGKRIIANNLEAPQIFSLIEILNSEKEVLGSVVALSKCKMLRIKREDFINALDDENIKNMAFNYLAKFSYNIIKNDIIYDKFDVEKAILKYFLNVSENKEKVEFSNSFIADMFRISERTLYRYLSSWEKKNFIIRSKGLVKINETNKKFIYEFLGDEEN